MRDPAFSTIDNREYHLQKRKLTNISRILKRKDHWRPQELQDLAKGAYGTQPSRFRSTLSAVKSYFWAPSPAASTTASAFQAETSNDSLSDAEFLSDSTSFFTNFTDFGSIVDNVVSLATDQLRVTLDKWTKSISTRLREQEFKEHDALVRNLERHLWDERERLRRDFLVSIYNPHVEGHDECVSVQALRNLI